MKNHTQPRSHLEYRAGDVVRNRWSPYMGEVIDANVRSATIRWEHGGIQEVEQYTPQIVVVIIAPIDPDAERIDELEERLDEVEAAIEELECERDDIADELRRLKRTRVQVVA